MFVTARFSRGQTVIETLIVLPLALMILFGIVYVSRLGVVSEHAQIAVRYGGTAAYNGQNGVYSAANIYENLQPLSAPQPCPTPALGAFNDSAPFPGPTNAPFWQPDSATPAAGSCNPVMFGLGGAQFLASHYFAATAVAATAGVSVPGYIQAALGEQSQIVNAQADFVHAASPGVIMYCSKEVRKRVDDAISADGSAVPPTPIPVGSTPDPSPPNNNGVCR